VPDELERMRESGTLKSIPVLRSPQGPIVEFEGRGEVLCLCSNDYLGLANHREVVAAGAAALERYGAGTASVRFICGKFAPQLELERDLAAFLHTEAALTYVSCWNANAALLDALCDERTAVFSDRLNHASIITGCDSRDRPTRRCSSTPSTTCAGGWLTPPTWSGG
jgi:glycine C-acetyltransferase